MILMAAPGKVDVKSPHTKTGKKKKKKKKRKKIIFYLFICFFEYCLGNPVIYMS